MDCKWMIEKITPFSVTLVTKERFKLEIMEIMVIRSCKDKVDNVLAILYDKEHRDCQSDGSVEVITHDIASKQTDTDTITLGLISETIDASDETINNLLEWEGEERLARYQAYHEDGCPQDDGLHTGICKICKMEEDLSDEDVCYECATLVIDEPPPLEPHETDTGKSSFDPDPDEDIPF